MVQVLDTQVVSYAAKGEYGASLAGDCISSITAKELLLMQTSHPTHARYYVPTLGTRHPLSMLAFRRLRPFPKLMTDSVTLELGPEWGTVIEYGDVAISRVINNGNVPLYGSAIRHLPKEERRRLLERFTFLLRSGVRCVPISVPVVELALGFLAEFVAEQNPKASFRNTLDDLLIAATALHLHARLVTYDQELIRFCRRASPQLLTGSSGTTVIDFSAHDALGEHKAQDSKGYLNRGWQLRLRRYHP